MFGRLVYAHGLAVSPNGSRLYVAARGSDSVAVFRRHPRTGAIAQLRRGNGCITSLPTYRQDVPPAEPSTAPTA